MAESEDCHVHSHHSFVPIESHHIFPLGMGGPDQKSNRINVCSNGHGEIHDYLTLLLRYGGKVPWIQKRRFGYRVRMVATSGYVQYKSHIGLPIT